MSFASEKKLIRRMYDAVYAASARRVGLLIRRRVFGRGNIGQNSILSRADIERAARAGRLTRASRALDVCCGDGSVVLHLARRFGATMHGIDFSSSGIKTARYAARRGRMSTRCLAIESEAEKMPFQDKVFDSVLSFDSFIHIHDKRRVLDECFRVLRPGGRLAFFDWVDLGGVPGKVQTSGDLWGYVYLSTVREYRRVLKKTGFDILRVKNNSAVFARIIIKWERVNRSFRDVLLKRCGSDYVAKAEKRWALARELAESGRLGQYLFVCEKEPAQAR